MNMTIFQAYKANKNKMTVSRWRAEAKMTAGTLIVAGKVAELPAAVIVFRILVLCSKRTDQQRAVGARLAAFSVSRWSSRGRVRPCAWARGTSCSRRTSGSTPPTACPCTPCPSRATVCTVQTELPGNSWCVYEYESLSTALTEL